jgi:alpha-glucosidase
LAPVEGAGSTVSLTNIDFATIPVHIKGGVVLPLRVESAMTTTELRKKDFEFVVATGKDGTASGSLYIDDGESIDQSQTTTVDMSFKGGKLDVKGNFGFPTGVNVARARFLNVQSAPKEVKVNGGKVNSSSFEHDATNKVLDVTVGVAFDKDLSVEFS